MWCVHNSFRNMGLHRQDLVPDFDDGAYDVSGAWSKYFMYYVNYAFTWCWHRCLQAKAVHVHWKERLPAVG